MLSLRVLAALWIHDLLYTGLPVQLGLGLFENVRAPLR